MGLWGYGSRMGGVNCISGFLYFSRGSNYWMSEASVLASEFGIGFALCHSRAEFSLGLVNGVMTA